MGAIIRILMVLVCLPACAAYYSTTWKYQDNQNPIFEGANWIHGKTTGLLWSNCQTTVNFACGTQTGTGTGNGQYTDSTAVLTGSWGQNQAAWGTVKIWSTGDPVTVGEEVELRLNSTITANNNNGYEIDYSCRSTSPGLAIVIWHGPQGGQGTQFDYLALDGTHYVRDGDYISATNNAGTIKLYVNGTNYLTATDSTFTGGSPGIGFFYDINGGSPGNTTNFGLTTFGATDGPETYVNHTAVSCDLSNAQASLNWCLNTDTNTLPAGNANWSAGALVITQAITLAGSGTNGTFITNNVNDWMIQINIPPAGTNFLTGICFAPGNSNSIYNCVYVQGSNDVRRFRAYNNMWYLSPGAFKFDTVFGVVDHNYIFNNAPGNKLAHIKDSVYNGLSSGNGMWTNGTSIMGTDQSIFFEDNTITSTNTTFFMSAIDAQAGGGYVFRHNTVTNSYVEGHGSEASYERSMHHAIIDGNFFDMKNVNQIVAFARGGLWFVYSNSINNVNSSACLKAEDNRMNNANLFGPFGGADGRNHWDKNTSGAGSGTVQSFSANPNVITVSGTPWTPSQWVGYTIRKTSGKAVTSVTQSGGLVTVSCTGHGFSNGDQVSVYGANQQEYNYMAAITVVDGNTFTQGPFNWLPTSPATGTIKCCKANYFAEVSANTANTVTFNASLYGAGFDMTFAAADTFEFNLVTQAMDGMGIYGGALIPSTVTPSFPGTWNDQVVYGSYQWSNNTGNATGIAWASSSGTIQVGVHIFNDTLPAGGYTPFAYPHYLVSPAQPQSTPAPQAILTGPFTLQGPAKIGAL